VAIVVIRVAFRVLVGGGDGGAVLFTLPQIPLPGWALGVRLLGPVTQESLLFGLYDGLRLATIVICVGAANALANPKRLLRSVPPALYEVGTALVVAVSVLPQLADSLRRVRAAQALRGGNTGRVRGIRRLLVPVLEDALERSLALAAGMDTRGYGRSGGLTPRQRRLTGALMLVALCGICVGVYAVLDRTAPRYLAAPMLVLGVGVAALALVSAGRRVQRTRYRPDRWQWPEAVVVASGAVVGVAGWWVSVHQPLVAYPSLLAWPRVGTVSLLAAAVGLGGALCAPPPAVPFERAPRLEPLPAREEAAA
jgi:energy-coupling factor transport system permease protein